MKFFGLCLVIVGLVFVHEGQPYPSKSIVLHPPDSRTVRIYFVALANMLHEIYEKSKGNGKPSKGGGKVFKNCKELYKRGFRQNGVYTIDPDGKGRFKVYCDQKTDGGGWTVIQKRQDGSVNFYRGWMYYKNGFGDLKGEFWLGLDKINRLTHQAKNRLRVDLMDTKGKTAYAEYDYFAVASERAKYKLSLGTYSGTAGDSLSYHRGMPFTTKDRDNDKLSGINCAVWFKGAWWHNRCHQSNLNGLYHHGKHKSGSDGVNWQHWKGHHYSAKRAEMKIRPV
ncbi:ryncolin-4 isoform X1 [Exaiptasia diaphana]|uniref:Fibrinogen C-terminal domain-containing protein n=1 Tax=Exaiptasia diaphana TaxID=2652724 RepID=A0A913XP23_EXADI|nr:ryncolin-4 isoform X1 [Exaiptasia diaphana]